MFNIKYDDSRKVYRVIGSGVPEDLEIKLRLDKGRYFAESNYSKKPSKNSIDIWQPNSMTFATEEQALENMLIFFASSKEPYIKIK